MWTELPSAVGGRPSPRTLAALAYVPSPLSGGTEGGLLLFGGRTVTGTLLADLWAFDLATSTWTELDDGGGGGPPARMAHSLTYDEARDSLVLVGGATNNGDTLLNDTWHYSQGGWIEAEAATAAAYHQAVYGDNAIILVSNREVWKYE